MKELNRNAKKKLLELVTSEIATERLLRHSQALEDVFKWAADKGIMPDSAVSSPFRLTAEQQFQMKKFVDVPQLERGLGVKGRDFQENHGYGEDKSASLAPRENWLWVYDFNSQPLRQWFRAVPGAPVFFVDISQLNFMSIKSVCFVENQDCFLSLSDYDFHFPTERMLFVYRGDKKDGSASKKLREKLVQENIPRIFFGDLDPKGLSMASKEGYTHFVHCLFQYFEEHATLADTKFDQRRFIAGAKGLGDSTVKNDILTIIESQDRYLSQQALKGVPLLLSELLSL